jgi:serine/threonine protein kinase
MCIKFVHSYSVEAQEKCTAMDCAPTLRGFECLDGGWNMVVMDVVSNDLSDFESQTLALLSQMTDKLVRLHQAGYVHGDVRDVNTMVKEDGSGFMLLDFDGAGKIGEAKYPMNVYAGPDLWRPEVAYDGELIKAEHDLQMLNSLFGCRL